MTTSPSAAERRARRPRPATSRPAALRAGGPGRSGGRRCTARSPAPPSRTAGRSGSTPVSVGYSTNARQQRGPGPQDHHAAAVAVAEVHQAVVQVALVGRGERLAAGRAPDDREQRVEDRHAEDQQRDDQRREEEVRLADELVRDRVGAAADDARRHGHQQPEQQRAAVAHEDPGRVEVVRQEADAHPDRDHRDQRADVRPESSSPRSVELLAVEEERAARRWRRCRRRARRARR